MEGNAELQDLRSRLKNIITGTCNTVGCGNCGLEWEEGGKKCCSATDLESRIYDIEVNGESND